MYLMLSIIAVIVLSGSGVEIQLETTTTNSTLMNVNTTETWNEQVNSTSAYTLQDPIWITFHYLLALIMMVYVLLQILTLFTKVN